jgi:hypothetical protein
LRHYTNIALATVFILAVVVQVAFHILKTSEGRPYENWDEMKPFNNAHVLVGPGSTRTFRYGSVDTFLQWAAIIAYNNLSMTGAAYSHLQYSNNVPQSWNDAYLSYKPKTWPYLDYDHFRGSDDRSPIFLSRIAHLLFAYCILLIVGLISIARLGLKAIYIIVPGLLLTATPDIYLQATQSLPNAINAVLTFTIVIFAMLFVADRNVAYLLIATSAFAVALNCKPDAVFAGGAIPLALALSLPVIGLHRACQAAVKAFLTFILVFVVTNPPFVFRPIQSLLLTYTEMAAAAKDFSRGNESIFANVQLLNAFVERNLLWEGAGIAFMLACGIILAYFVAAWLRRAASYSALAIGAAITLVTWGVVVLTMNSPHDRYFINGLGALLATVAMCLVVLDANGRRAVRLMLAVLIVIYFVRASSNASQSLGIHLTNKEYEGFDPRHHRNLASLYAIKAVNDQGFSPTVLVDQHAYVDLVPFRRAGMDATYINAANVAKAIASLSRCNKYAVIYGKGSYNATADPRFRNGEGEWPLDLMRAYDAYQARLSELPILRQYSGGIQRLLSSGPVQKNDDVTVAVLSTPCADVH